MLNLLSDRKMLLSVGAGAMVVGLGAWLFLEMRQSKEAGRFGKKARANRLSNKTRVFAKDSIYSEKIVQLRRELAPDLEVGRIPKVGFINIVRLIVHVVQKDFLDNLVQSRQIRRKFISSPSEYAKEYLKSASENELVMEEGTLDVLEDLNIEYEFYQSEYKRNAEEDPQFSLLNKYVVQSMKNNVPSTREVTVDHMIDFFQFQISEFDSIKVESFQDVPIDQRIGLKEIMLSDKASMRFGIEEEDLLKNTDVIKDPRIRSVQNDLQKLISFERQKYIQFSY